MRDSLHTMGTAAASQLFFDVLPWLLAILGIAVAGAIIIMIVRRSLRSDSGGNADGFTLQSLRDLRDQGQISDEEFQRAREAMIGRIKREVDKPAKEAQDAGGSENESKSAATDSDDSPSRGPNSDKPA